MPYLIIDDDMQELQSVAQAGVTNERDASNACRRIAGKLAEIVARAKPPQTKLLKPGQNP